MATSYVPTPSSTVSISFFHTNALGYFSNTAGIRGSTSAEHITVTFGEEYFLAMALWSFSPMEWFEEEKKKRVSSILYRQSYGDWEKRVQLHKELKRTSESKKYRNTETIFGDSGAIQGRRGAQREPRCRLRVSHSPNPCQPPRAPPAAPRLGRLCEFTGCWLWRAVVRTGK